MQPFAFEQAATLEQATRAGVATGQGQSTAVTQYLAGGTTLVDLMKLNVLRPRRVIDINSLRTRFAAVELSDQGLKLGAFAKMSQVADHADVIATYPVIAQSLQLAASAQLRNMATLGGNVLQKTRCPYYRDPSWHACNKRAPGSGCAALTAVNRNHAVLGIDDSCIAQYPGDFAIALIALDARVELASAKGERTLPFAELHRSVDGKPHVETNLRDGEIITAFLVPKSAVTRRSLYLKIRDRASYEFAIASAAVALDLEGETVREARIGLGGMAYKPWRSREAEQVLKGKPLTEANVNAAAKVALAGARTHGDNDYKPELARQTIVRALLSLSPTTIQQRV